MMLEEGRGSRSVLCSVFAWGIRLANSLIQQLAYLCHEEGLPSPEFLPYSFAPPYC